MKELYLLDVSGYLYRAYFALPKLTNERGESTHALYGFIRSVQRLIKDYSPSHLIAVFDGPNNKRSREEIYTDYKAHRPPTPEDLPQQIVWAERFCELSGIPCLSLEGVEADDVMGSVATWAAREKKAKVFLCTADKDLAQLVSQDISILNPLKENALMDVEGVKKKFGVSPTQIIDYLALVGDTSDNIPGLPGFGPKTAVSLLQEFGSLERILEDPEKVSGKKKQETLREKAELARISYRLATIDTNLDCPQEESFYRYEGECVESLAHFYSDLRFHSLLRELEKKRKPEKEEEVVYHLVDDSEKMTNLIARLAKAEEVCFDTETTDSHPLRAEIVGIGFAISEGEAWYIPFNGSLKSETILEGIRPLFEDGKRAFYGHNVKYDVHILANYGIRVARLGFDTILASYLLNSHQRRHSLDQLALQYFSKVKTPLKELIGSGKQQITMAEVDIEKACHYCCEDADYTLRLRKVLGKELEERGLAKLLFDMELPLLPVLAKMERTGIYVDKEQLRKLGETLRTELRQLTEKIYQLAGEPFTINSPKQLSQILFDKMAIQPPKKTATGYSTSADVLEGLAAEHPIAASVLEYRKLEKLRSTYVETLPEMILSSDHRIHCTFHQTIAATGRLSSTDPNLQNIPVRTEMGREIRAAFRPEKEGWLFLSADYSQIELRLMAHMSQDPALLEAFHKGCDIHKATAARVFNIPVEEVTSTQRYQAKAVNFGILYGQQAFGLSRELRISVKEAGHFITRYFERYPKVKEYIQKSIERARSEGRATTLTGRERLIPEIDSSNTNLRQAAERLAVNTPLQGTAADIIKLAMIEVDRRIQEEGLKSKMLLQIHDELFFEVPEGESTRAKELVKSVMEGVYTLDVPLIVDVSVGKNWREC